MKVITFSNENSIELYANTYVLIDNNHQCVIIDPSNDNDEIKNFIKENDLSIKGILLTHGHFDHIRGVDHLEEAFDVPLYINEFDKALLTTPKLNCSDKFSRHNIIIKSEPVLVKDGDGINLLDEEIVVITTPYHTEGSVVYYLPKSQILFSGDSLFAGSFGRSDLPTSIPRLMHESVMKMFALPKEVIVYPGHGPKTTIGQESLL